MVEFDESPYTPDELLMMRSVEAIKIPAAQADQSLAMIYRKAAAFDRLAAMATVDCVIEIVPYVGSVTVRRSVIPGHTSVREATLLEAIEALPQTNGEPKHEH